MIRMAAMYAKRLSESHMSVANDQEGVLRSPFANQSRVEKRGFSSKHLRSFAASGHSSGIFIQPGESFSDERYYREDRDICRFDSGAQRNCVRTEDAPHTEGPQLCPR